MSRRLAVWSVILLVFVACVAAAAVAGGGGTLDAPTRLDEGGATYVGTTIQSGDEATVAVVPITGTMVNGRSAADGSTTGSEDIVRMIDAIADEDAFDGIVLELNTPGGGVLAAAEIEEAIRIAQDDHDIEVVAWMRDTAASAGYYVSAPADRIIAHPTTFTGSIGVIMQYVDVEQLADKVGVRPVVIKSGKLKDIGSPYRKLTPQERGLLQDIIDEAYVGFVDVVAAGRDMPKSEVRRIADGRIYTGRQAQRNGLVDELGGRREAYAAMAKLLDAGDGDDIEVVEFAREYSWTELLGASTSPVLDLASTARAATGLVTGRDAGGFVVPGRAGRKQSGFVSLEYRAVLG